MSDTYDKTGARGSLDQTDITIRRAGADDAERVAAIGRVTFVEAFGHLYPEEDLMAFLDSAHSVSRAEKDLADPRTAIWLAEDSAEVVGYAVAGPSGLPKGNADEADGELDRLYVRAKCQGAGIGTRLLAEALAWLEKDGPRTLWIGVWSENYGAQGLYARHGFKVVGAHKFVVGQTVDKEFTMCREP